MSIDTKSDFDQIQDLRHSPSIAPLDEQVAPQASPKMERASIVIVPKATSWRSASLFKRQPVGGLAMAGLVLGLSIYLVAIVAIAVCAFCWLPFSENDPVAT